MENLSDTGLVIRPVEEADLPRLYDIAAEGYADIYESMREEMGDAVYRLRTAGLSPYEAKKRQLDAAYADDSFDFFCVCDGELPVAFCFMRCDYATKIGRLHSNAVASDYRGRAIGVKMYGYMLERMKKRGMIAAMVCTGGDEAHAPARRAYEKAGFDHAQPEVTYYKYL